MVADANNQNIKYLSAAAAKYLLGTGMYMEQG